MRKLLMLQELEAIVDDDNSFAWRTSSLVKKWEKRKITIAYLDNILTFMEEHQSTDFGSPGPLVHFVEKHFNDGDVYEEKLLQSLERKPMWYTTWMLHRVINATTDEPTKTRYLNALRQIVNHPLANSVTKSSAADFLEFQAEVDAKKQAQKKHKNKPPKASPRTGKSAKPKPGK